MPFRKFKALWGELGKEGFVCINTSDARNAYEGYLKDRLAIRFAAKGTLEPNFELKFPKSKYNDYSMARKVEIILNGNRLATSEIEMQIAFKLRLGSDKDYEDARHLYEVFKGHLDMDLLKNHINQFGVTKAAGTVLWEQA